MTATRLVSVEALAAALHATIPYPSTWPGGDHSKWSQHYAERIFAALPAAPAEPAPTHGVWSHGPNISEVTHCPEPECIEWRTTPHFYAAPAEAGLRAALAALISDAIGDNEGCPHHYGNLGYSCTCEIPVDAIRAALAAQKGAGAQEGHTSAWHGPNISEIAHCPLCQANVYTDEDGAL